MSDVNDVPSFKSKVALLYQTATMSMPVSVEPNFNGGFDPLKACSAAIRNAIYGNNEIILHMTSVLFKVWHWIILYRYLTASWYIDFVGTELPGPIWGLLLLSLLGVDNAIHYM